MFDKYIFENQVKELLRQVEEHVAVGKDREWKAIGAALKEILVLLDATYAETGGQN
jgi:hypothetical protein